MGTTVLHADAGYSLTEEHWGEDNPGTGTWNWTETYGAGGVQTWGLYGEDGRLVSSLFNTTPGSPYQVNWASYSGGMVAGFRPKITRTKNTSGATVYFDAEWDEANTDDNLCGDALAELYFDWSDPSGRGTYADGTAMGYCRDLSGNERTLLFTHDEAAGADLDTSPQDSVSLVLVDNAIEFATGRNYVTPAFPTLAEWTLEVEAKFALGDRDTPIIGSDGPSGIPHYELKVDATNHVVATTANFAGTIFTATSTATVDSTLWHTYRVSRDASSLTVLVDGVEVAAVATTGTAPFSDQVIAVNKLKASTTRRNGWYRSVKLFSEADHSLARINLAPSPGGVLTATALPRGRVRIGMSVSPDGGAP